ncbi:AraC family transcriptional regulator [Chitinophaga pinensis]|uniref:Transcriptional regulator, AraC family n=1 Tax=Chitinophaga pinensis (strain ATCC 43595 / DSM 2588 / LMG 13176 / NBRC 15968 / NCIMB 11800 / UQM 2034) TaxID=485918 RepID=A0A979GRD0_CHIPD|nr:AraC family transcriptional regulator [Chitinophaga pinensis]ACU60843.1 transcriptional regulator, AraC family [Chitinophaga pinensis DSM 2588]
MENVLKQFFSKKFGYIDFDADTADDLLYEEYNSFIKVLFMEAGSEVMVDFKEYKLEKDALFFIKDGQWYKCAGKGTLLYYNRDFYCIQIHDAEVACDGLLYNNVYDVPVVYLDGEASRQTRHILEEIKMEAVSSESSTEEMIRIFLKQLIIRSTRMWKKTHDMADNSVTQEVEFLRKFSQLVEAHYIKHHNVADYADMLSITPKALSKKISKYSAKSPNDIIKDRIILEAKRLLIHTDLSVKEIGYKLGYEDPAYFVRLFTNQTESSPLLFRKKYAEGEKVQ